MSEQTVADIEKLGAPLPSQRRSQIANPAPLGLLSFASTTLVFSLYNVNALQVTVPNAAIGMAIFYGGLCQFIAGMWEFAAGNTFGATAFSSYGAYWLAFATIFIPSSGITAAYEGEPAMKQHAMGLFHLAYMLLTFLFFIATLRKSIGLSVVFFSLGMTLLVLTVGFLSNKASILKAGGYVGMITAGIAYYCGVSELLGPNDIFTLPMGKHE